jgi:phosphoglycerol transferase MdoB-like AlkP superfamily enzyme
MLFPIKYPFIRQAYKHVIGFVYLFAWQQLFFLLYFWNRTFNIEGWSTFGSLWHALPLHLSTACYLSALYLPFFFTFSKWKDNTIWKGLWKGLSAILITLTTIIFCVDIVVYEEMGIKLHYKILFHLQNPVEVVTSVSTKTWLIGIMCISVFSHWFYRKFHKRTFKLLYEKDTRTISPFSIVRNGIEISLLIGLLFLGIRGGWRPIPINESNVYYSNKQVLNDAAVNPSWTLMHSYLNNIEAGDKNPYEFMKGETASTIVDSLYRNYNQDSCTNLFSINKPNIALLILEGWSANVVASCGGDAGLTPNFDALSKEGLLFTQAYCSGHTSDQGIPAILSGFPAQPITTIIANNSKYPHMPCLNKDLKQIGYHSSFLFGGQLTYGNIKSYLYYEGFEEIKEQDNFNAPNELVGKLGIHDAFMFKAWGEQLTKQQQPFLSVLFTASTHSPFDGQYMRRISGGGEEHEYINSIYYADSCLGSFFNWAKLQAWYSNTIFIIVADHGHHSLREHDYASVSHYQIPLLICGGGLNKAYVGKIHPQVVSQTDIAHTLLHASKISSANYRWSKSLINAKEPFAFFDFYEGYGWVDPNGSLVWNKLAGDKYTTDTYPASISKEKAQLKSRAYLQDVFAKYLSY